MYAKFTVSCYSYCCFNDLGGTESTYSELCINDVGLQSTQVPIFSSQDFQFTGPKRTRSINNDRNTFKFITFFYIQNICFIKQLKVNGGRVNLICRFGDQN